MGSIAITPVDSSEMDALRALSVETFLETFADQNSPEAMTGYVAQAFSRERISAELAEPQSRFFFARDGETIAVYLKLNVGEAQTERKLPNAMEVERIYASKAYLGRGVGKAMMDFALVTAREHGVRWLWLGVWEENSRAIAFYEKAGFERFGTHTFMMGDEAQSDIMMRIAV